MFSWDECLPPPPSPIVADNIIYVSCEKLEHLENK
jgi:hypothetical protein